MECPFLYLFIGYLINLISLSNYERKGTNKSQKGFKNSPKY
jgi:hypothetical protein